MVGWLVQAVMRPSEFVTDVKMWVGVEDEGEDGWRVRVTGMLAAGRPMEVSRTWHVIGGLVVGWVIVVGAGW